MNKISLPCVVCCAVFEPKYKKQKYCSLKCFHSNRTQSSRAPQNIKQKFLRKVIQTDGCWSFVGLRNKAGYGRVLCRGKMQLAHRVSYELFNGQIPNGLCVLHKCDNPQCTNPKHLFLGTNADNNADKAQKGRALKGETHSMAKLSEKQVRKIYSDERPYAIISAEYGISKPQICGIKSGKFWKHLNLTKT